MTRAIIDDISFPVFRDEETQICVNRSESLTFIKFHNQNPSDLLDRCSFRITLSPEQAVELCLKLQNCLLNKEVLP